MCNVIQTEIKLSIGILVSNRKQYIRKVMESIKPLLEQLPCELVVVDTKGKDTDGSIDIVREYTEKIYSFEWCNDFSAARNYGMRYATGEWFLFIDDDEWFEDVTELIRFFQSEESKEYGRGIFYIKNYTDTEKYSLNVVERMVRRNASTKFVGKMHERLEGIGGEKKYFSCEITHVGYIYADESARKKHQERNLGILLEELKKEGEKPRIIAQIVQEYLSVDDTVAEGIALAKSSLATWKGKQEMRNISAQWLLTVVARKYRQEGKYENLFAWVDEVRRTFPCSELTELVLSATVANSAAEKKDFKVVLEQVTQYLKQWDWLQHHVEEKNRQLQLDLPTYMTEEYYALMLYLGGVSATREKKYAQAVDFWKSLPWEAAGGNKEVYRKEMFWTFQKIRQAAVEANRKHAYKEAYSYWELLPWDMSEFNGNEFLQDMQITLKGLEAGL